MMSALRYDDNDGDDHHHDHDDHDDDFYIALFSSLEQTHCCFVAYYSK